MSVTIFLRGPKATYIILILVHYNYIAQTLQKYYQTCVEGFDTNTTSFQSHNITY